MNGLKNKAVFFVVLFLLAGAGFLFASVEEYKKAVDLDSNNIVKRYNLGFAYYQEKMYDKAIDSLKKTLEMNSGDRESHDKVDINAAQILGIIYFNYKGNDNEAIKYFNKVVSLNPGDGDNYYYMGLAYLRKGESDNALKSFLNAIDKNAKSSMEANFRIGQIYYEKKLYGDAIAALKKVVSVDPEHIEANQYLGNIYHERKKYGLAIKYLKVVVKYNPENFNAYYLLGLNYFAEKKYDKMISAYKKAIIIKPDFPDAHYNLGMAYYYRGSYEDAIKELEIAKKLDQSDSATFSLLAQTKAAAYESHLSKGTTFYTEEDYTKAEEEFELALKAKPGDSEANKYLGKTRGAIKKEIPVKLKKAENYYKKGMLSEAWREWKFVNDMDSSNSVARDGLKKIEKNSTALIAAKEKLAKKLMNEGRYAEALKEYRAIKLIPGAGNKSINAKITAVKAKQRSKADVILEAAAARYKKKNYKGAIQKYKEVLKFDEGNEKALNGITKVNQKIESEKDKYLAFGKQNRSSHPQKAITYYKKVMGLDPNNDYAARQIEKLTGKKSQIMVNAKEVKTLYYKGVDKYVNGEIESAIKIWTKVLAIDKGYVEAEKNIKRAREKLAAIKKLSK